MLFVINGQLGRRNISDIDRIRLVSQREEILRRQAKANQSAAGKQTALGKFADVLSERPTNHPRYRQATPAVMIESALELGMSRRAEHDAATQSC